MNLESRSFSGNKNKVYNIMVQLELGWSFRKLSRQIETKVNSLQDGHRRDWQQLSVLESQDRLALEILR